MLRTKEEEEFIRVEVEKWKVSKTGALMDLKEYDKKM